MSNYYDILGVSQEATDDDIREAYKFQIKALHPDKYNSETHPKEYARALAMSERLNEARDALLNLERRKEHDSKMSKGDAEPSANSTPDNARTDSRSASESKGNDHGNMLSSWFHKRKRAKKLPEFLNVPWSLRDCVVFVVAWLGIQIIVVLGLKVAAPVLPAVQQFLSGAANGTNTYATFVLDLVDAAAGLGVVALYLRHYKVGWSKVGWRKVNLLKAVGYLIAILLIFIVLSNVVLILVSWLVPSFNANQTQTTDFSASGPHQSLALIGLVLLPPILEETIFRGFLFPALAKKWGVIWGAIGSSAIFGLAHAQANISIYTFLLGLLLCFMYVRLKSIYPGMAVHMLNNYLAFLALSAK